MADIWRLIRRVFRIRKGDYQVTVGCEYTPPKLPPAQSKATLTESLPPSSCMSFNETRSSGFCESSEISWAQSSRHTNLASFDETNRSADEGFDDEDVFADARWRRCGFSRRHLDEFGDSLRLTPPPISPCHAFPTPSDAEGFAAEETSADEFRWTRCLSVNSFNSLDTVLSEFVEQKF